MVLREKNLPSGLSFDQLKELEDLRHRNRMDELEFERSTFVKKIEDEMGMLRLRNANMNRMIDKKEFLKEKWFDKKREFYSRDEGDD